MDGNQQPQQPEQSGSWQFVPDDAAQTTIAPAPYTGTVPAQSIAIPPTGSAGSITWTASEFIAHQKSARWFGVLAGLAVIGAIVAVFLIKDVITAVAIVGAAGLLAAFAKRQPRELTYRIDQHGLQIGRKSYTFADFRSYAVMSEGAFASIAFTPLKRFAPMLSVYYDPKDEQKIADVLSEYLPYEPRRPDAIERLMWRIRF